MVEIRENNNQMQENNNTTPETITTSMILEDLENGIDRTGIKTKYNLETWEVKQMFDHPTLKGKKAKKVKKLSFNFVDDMTMESSDPNQLDLEDQIREESQEADDALQKIEDIADAAEELGIDESKVPSKPELYDSTEDMDYMESKADDWSNNY
tara:strand:+ start:102 stop:563 length:462 start_codon:yes stop_codon:yes gene_type:complete